MSLVNYYLIVMNSKHRRIGKMETNLIIT